MLQSIEAAVQTQILVEEKVPDLFGRKMDLRSAAAKKGAKEKARDARRRHNEVTKAVNISCVASRSGEIAAVHH